ncbi:DUF4186 domain-containing protein [Acidipropionibacterium jensenii]|uniref:DUF4186 domain-containing protein n=1 Tax=Acidipropionibacterium jensenii TaxID=1749 RepID=UPI001C2FD0F5|nr:DUF4186 domain-containing protein [Acidipropionibacterium jensenii]
MSRGPVGPEAGVGAGPDAGVEAGPEAGVGAGGPADRRPEAVAATLARLRRSTFRSRFHLSASDRDYARAKGRQTIVDHARDLLRGRIGAAAPHNDGRQTPMRGHPVFIAQHATATCCRGCVAKWHGIAAGHQLTDVELDRLVEIVMAWIDTELTAHPASPTPDHPTSD